MVCRCPPGYCRHGPASGKAVLIGGHVAALPSARERHVILATRAGRAPTPSSIHDPTIGSRTGKSNRRLNVTGPCAADVRVRAPSETRASAPLSLNITTAVSSELPFRNIDPTRAVAYRDRFKALSAVPPAKRPSPRAVAAPPEPRAALSRMPPPHCQNGPHRPGSGLRPGRPRELLRRRRLRR